MVNNSASTQTLNVPVSLSVATAFNAAAGSLVVNSNITLGSASLTLNGNNNFALNGNVSGTGNFTLNGAGALSLAGGSLTAGAVSFNNGTTTITEPVSAGNGTTYIGYTSANGVVNVQGTTFNDGGEIRVGGSDISGAAPNGTGTFNITNSVNNCYFVFSIG